MKIFEASKLDSGIIFDRLEILVDGAETAVIAAWLMHDKTLVARTKEIYCLNSQQRDIRGFTTT